MNSACPAQYRVLEQGCAHSLRNVLDCVNPSICHPLVDERIPKPYVHILGGILWVYNVQNPTQAHQQNGSGLLTATEIVLPTWA